MATRGTINELYDLSSLEGQQQAVLSFIKQYVDSVKAANAVQITLGSAKGAKDITAAIKQLNAEQQKLADLQLKIAKAETEYARARVQSNKADGEAVRTKKQQLDLEVKVAKEKERLIKNAEKEAKTIEKLNNEYIDLNNRYKDASAASLKRGAELLKEANGNETLFKSLLKTDKEYLATTKSASDYSKQLLTLEQNVGRSQRNVGNYASAYNGLNTSFARIAQELPNAAISFQTFALAISNNLPIAAEQIAAARTEIAKLKAEGMAAPSLFSQIGKAIFSFQVGLSIAILAFVTYSKQISEFFKEVFKGKESIDQLKKSQELLNKTIGDGNNEYADAVGNVQELTINIGLAKEGLLDKNKVLKQYNESIGQVTGEVKNLDEAEQALVKNGEAYIRMMLFKAAANLALEEAAKKAFEAEQNRRKKEEEFANAFDRAGQGMGSVPDAPGDLDAEVEQRAKEKAAKRKARAVKEAEDSQKVLFDIATKFQRDAAEISSKFKFDFFDGKFEDKGKKDKSSDDRKKQLEDELKARRELILLQIQDQINFNETIINDDKQSFEKRVQAANNFYDLTRQLLEKQAEFEAEDIDKKAKEAGIGEKQIQDQKLLVKAQLNSKLIELEKNNANQLSGIVKDQVDADTKATIEAYEKRIKAIQDAFAIIKSTYDKQRDEEILALNEQAAATAMPFEEQQKKRLDIIRKYAKLELEAQLDNINKLLALETNPVKKAELEAQAAAIRLKIDDQLTEGILDNIKKKEDAEKHLAELQKQLQQEVFNLVKTFALGRFDAAKNAIQGEIDASEEKKRKEIEAIQASGVSQIEMQARISNAEKKAQSDRERLELRQRQIDIQRAKFEKAFAVAQVAINTLQAVAKIQAQIAVLVSNPVTAAYAAVAASQIPLTIALGAVQAAAILATPIPKFKMGKGEYDNYEGPAWVGDGGKSEMIIREDGSVERTPSTPVMTWVGKNDIVHPDADALLNHTLKKQGQTYSYASGEGYAFDQINTTLKTGFSQLQKTVQNKREWFVDIKNGETNVVTRDGTRTKEYLNKNLQFGK